MPNNTLAPVEKDMTPLSAHRRFSAGFDRFGLLYAFAVLIIVFSIAMPQRFLTTGNLANILGSQAVLFMISLAALIPTLLGEFVDISLGATAGLTAMTIAILDVNFDWPVLLSCLGGLVVALLVGAVNAFFVVRFKNDPFIITVGTMTIIEGVIFLISDRNSVGPVTREFTNWVYSNKLFGIPLEFYYGLAFFLLVWYVLSFTPVGQKAIVVGQSREVARLSGIHVSRYRTLGFIIGAGIAGIAGIFFAATNGTVDPNAGASLILPAFAAVFLGGTAFKPGRMNPLGTFFAVYFLATGTLGLQLLGTQNYVQQIFYGGVLVLAVTVPKLRRRAQLQAGHV
jgi:ribose transport system permease protein